METIRTAWNLFLFLSLLVVPQMLGVLAYFRVKKYHNFLAHLVGFLIPPLSFFYLSAVILISSQTREAHSRGEEVCGTFTGIMFLFILFLTSLQTVFSLIAQLSLHISRRIAKPTKL
ncbi:MAG TPA: hypothetical protein VLJ61_17665 [Pyrinomonadaceae bacterium]|nr:hypothetical protein [Pyrinomonadaceae bacterium]